MRAGRLNITKEQAVAQIGQMNFLKVPATVQDTANAAVLIASDRARMVTGTVVNASAGAAGGSHPRGARKAILPRRCRPQETRGIETVVNA